MTDEEKKESAPADLPTGETGATADKEKSDETEMKVEDIKEEAKAEKPKAEKKTEPTGKNADLIKQIEKMSVLELSELVKVLEERFGVSAAAPMMVAASGAAPAAAEAIEEKTNFNVMLTSAGDQKIAVIKAVRELRPDLGLVDAKTLVESAPKEVLKDAKKADAEAAKVKLEAAGAKVELK